MKRFFFFLSLVVSLASTAQTYNGDYFNAKKRLTIRGVSIDSIRNDSTGFAFRTKSLFTGKAIADYVRAQVVSSGGWPLGGVSGTTFGTNFIGTTDNVQLAFKVNNQISGYIGNIHGGTAYGYNAGKKYFEIGILGGYAFGPECLRDCYEVSLGANTAIGGHCLTELKDGPRNTAVGFNVMRWAKHGSYNVGVGVFALETAGSGAFNTAVGSESYPGLRMGNYNTGNGAWTGYRSSSRIIGVNITAPGTGWTSGTATFSSPLLSVPSFPTILATGTLVISGGSVVGVTNINNNAGYSIDSLPVTVTFSGDGTGATGVPVLAHADGNTYSGFASGGGNNTGDYNSAYGYQSGYTGLSRTNDSGMTYIGAFTDRTGSGVYAKSTALGYGALVGQSNSIVLGVTGADQPNVGIGIATPNRSALLDITSTTAGVLIPRMTTAQQNAISSPATGLLIWNTDSLALCSYNSTAWLKVSQGGGGSSYTATQPIEISGGNVISMKKASATDSGWVSTGSQTFQGYKQFNTGIQLRPNGAKQIGFYDAAISAEGFTISHTQYSGGGQSDFVLSTSGGLNPLYIEYNTGNTMVNGTLGISPTSTHDVVGSTGSNITTTSSNITLDFTNSTVIITGGTPTVTLPSASGSTHRRKYTIVNQTGSAVTISSYLDYTGASATTIGANSSITIHSTASNWYRIN